MEINISEGKITDGNTSMSFGVLVTWPVKNIFIDIDNEFVGFRSKKIELTDEVKTAIANDIAINVFPFFCERKNTTDATEHYRLTIKLNHAVDVIRGKYSKIIK